MTIGHPYRTIVVGFLVAFVLFGVLLVSGRVLAQKDTQKPGSDKAASSSGQTKTEQDDTYGKGGTKETTTEKNEDGDTVTRVVQKDKDGYTRHGVENEGDNQTDVTLTYDKQGRLSSVEITKKKKNKVVGGTSWRKRFKNAQDSEGTVEVYDDVFTDDWLRVGKAHIADLEATLKRFGVLLFPEVVNLHVPAASPQSAPQTAAAQLVGFVYDKDSQPGDQVSASLVTNPKDYASNVALVVVEMQIPVNRSETGQTVLQGLVIDLGDGPQAADQPLTLKIPQSATTIPIRVSPRGSGTAVAQTSAVLQRDQHATPSPNTGKGSDFTMPPVWQNTSVVTGPLSGNAQTLTHITVDNQPVRIVTETPRRAYLDTTNTPAGAHTLVVEDGPRRASFPGVVKPSVTLNAGQLELLKGQTTTWTATVELPLPAPGSAWQHGGASFGPTDLSTIAKLFPGFHVPRAGEPAIGLFWVTNGSPETVSFKPSRNDVLAVVLRQQNFKNGEWKLPEPGVIQSKRSGRFVLNGFLETFFAPIHGEEAPGDRLSGAPQVPRPAVPQPTTPGRPVIGAPPKNAAGAGVTIAIPAYDPEKKKDLGKTEIFSDPKVERKPCDKQGCGTIQTLENGKIQCVQTKELCGGKDCPKGTCHLFQGWIDPKDKNIPESEKDHPEQMRERGDGVAPATFPPDKAKDFYAIKPEKGRKYGCGCI